MSTSTMRKATIVLGLSTVLLASIVGCAPQERDDGQNEPSAASSQVAFSWAPDSDCAMCHAKETSSMDDGACLASTHKAEGTDCATCHADTASLQTAHEDATAEEAAKRATKLRVTEIDQDACLSCHDGEDGHSASTAASTVLTDSQGTTVNPHDLPDNDEHADATCGSCHDMHGDSPVAIAAPEYCASCHHSNVYECHTCHE